MTPETEQSLSEAVSWLKQTAESTQAFAAEQAPLYCQEVLAWEFWSGIALAIPAGLFGLLFAIITLKIARKDDEELAVAATAMCAMVFLGVFCAGFADVIKTHVAPRVVIVEHLQKVLNSTVK